MKYANEMQRVAYERPVTDSEQANAGMYFRRIDDRLAAGLTLNK